MWFFLIAVFGLVHKRISFGDIFVYVLVFNFVVLPLWAWLLYRKRIARALKRWSRSRSTDLDMAATDVVEEPVDDGAVTAASATVYDNIEMAVESTPEGADIVLDGTFVGNTPANIKASKGCHVLRIERQGFVSWERTIEASTGLKVAPHLVSVSREPKP